MPLPQPHPTHAHAPGKAGRLFGSSCCCRPGGTASGGMEALSGSAGRAAPTKAGRAGTVCVPSEPSTIQCACSGAARAGRRAGGKVGWCVDVRRERWKVALHADGQIDAFYFFTGSGARAFPYRVCTEARMVQARKLRSGLLPAMHNAFQLRHAFPAAPAPTCVLWLAAAKASGGEASVLIRKAANAQL